MGRIRLLSAVGATRLLVILGASGAGKSSFLRAGLLPRLEYDGRRFLPLRVIRPERAALFGENGLLTRWRRRCRMAAGGKFARRSGRGARASGGSLSKSGTRRPAGVRSEAGESSRLSSSFRSTRRKNCFASRAETKAPPCWEIVRFLAHEEQPAVIVIFAIRSDSYDACEHAKPLEGLPQSTAALLPMPREAYNEVIEAPARRFANAGGKLAIEPQLTQRLLQDIDRSGSGDALPLLAFTLEQLFLEYRGTGVLRLANYEEFGGLRGAINAAVERAFGRADADARIPATARRAMRSCEKGSFPGSPASIPTARASGATSLAERTFPRTRGR